MHVVTIGEFKRICKLLKDKVQNSSREWSAIYPIPKNGFIVAHQMNLKLPIIYDPELIEENTLVVDDIVDSGETLKKLKVNLNQVAVLYNKSDLKIPFVVENLKGAWIKFHWEKENDVDDCINRLIEYAGMEVDETTVKFIRNLLEKMRKGNVK